MIDSDSIEQLKARLDVVDVVGNYVALKKNGANFKGLCPFHGEKTPSFVVSPVKQIYHCFGCGAGGDSIKFIMEHLKLSYPEAIEKLADEYNFTLQYTKSQPKINTQPLEQMKHFYIKNLHQNSDITRYLHERGVSSATAEKFELGFAPFNETIMGFINASLIPKMELVELGVLGEDSGRVYPRLNQRVIFPIYSTNGKLIGFGGRTTINHQAKYINSPQTKLFNKSRVLYGYHLAREEIFRKKRVIVAEGYMDVVMLHQAGFNTAVATLGTSLTNEHLPLLKKGEPRVILAYDGDDAGINAAYRASLLLAKSGMEGGVVIFNQGMDPADMVKAHQIDTLSELFEHPKAFIPFIFEILLSRYDLKNYAQKQKAIGEATQILRELPIFMANQYRSYVSALLNVPEGFVRLKPTKEEQTPSAHQDIKELSIIKSMLENRAFIDVVLDYIDKSFFKYHAGEFEALISNQESPRLTELELNEDINAFNDEQTLKSELKILSIGFLTQRLQTIREDSSTSLQEKSFLIRETQEKILRLRRGERWEH